MKPHTDRKKLKAAQVGRLLKLATDGRRRPADRRWATEQLAFCGSVGNDGQHVVTTKDKKAALRRRYQLQVTIAAAEIITDHDDGKRWLQEPCPQLAGGVPLKVATTKRGTAEVLRLLKYWPGPEEGLAHLRMVAKS